MAVKLNKIRLKINLNSRRFDSMKILLRLTLDLVRYGKFREGSKDRSIRLNTTSGQDI